MNTNQNNYLINSCQYTPVYLAQNTGAIQGQSYIVAQGKIEEAKPLTNNLKRFYENSGIFDNNIPKISKPRILKKQEIKSVGNNLKLANFLVPKSVESNLQDNLSKQCFTTNNVLKHSLIPVNVVNTVPKAVDGKIVKIKNFPSELKPKQNKLVTKNNKPKEKSSISNPIKHTSVQLLKLGETYHSLNQLSDEQMKMVNQALKIFNNPNKTAKSDATYDPITNTRFIYKVVSPKEINAVGKNKIVINNRKDEVKMELKIVQKKELKLEQLPIKEEILDEESYPPVEVKVTRSGRKVKSPKQMEPENTTHKPKKKAGSLVSCFQCSTEFCSLYRLQKHYEIHPTHIPAKIHSNLFHCLLAIIKGASEEDRSNILIEQLQQLVDKLRSLLPCLFKENDGSKGNGCTINDDIGRLLGINPGKYNINVDALTCVKDKDGNCRHNPPKSNQVNSVPSATGQVLFTINNENVELENKAEDSTATNLVNKRLTTQKRFWNSNQQEKQRFNAKKRREDSESSELINDVGTHDLLHFNHDQSAINEQPNSIVNNSIGNNLDKENPLQQPTVNENLNNIIKLVDSSKSCISSGTHTQFHSAHFDIRSSPIKPSTGVFRKFQINPEKLAKYDVQIIRPLELENGQTEISEESSTMLSIPRENDTSDLQSIFTDDLNIQLSQSKDSCVGIPPELTFDVSKDWIIQPINDKSIESFKTSGLIEPSLLHENTIDNLSTGNIISDTNNQIRENDSQNSSVLNFLESLGNECLIYPETEITSNPNENVDFQLDLFSFNNT
ncbi:unnamed protein product [Chilo suppressalis]|uniref:C2H2-type domain-containing protein n=1 Tax=Chilo suppressalis TaxID=168631 RepID=A0ABN8EF71_CHISP|nr:unnamed protein product [Chilo suppressalis]